MKINFLIFSLLLPVHVFGQSVVVSNSKSPMVYAGIDNPIYLSVPNVAEKDLVFKTRNGVFFKRAGQFYLFPGDSSGKVGRNKEDRQADLYIGRKHKKDTIWLDTIYFRIFELNAKCYYGSKNFGSISVGELMAIPFLIARFGQYCIEGYNFRISSFRMTAIGEQTYFKTTVNGGKLTREVKDALSKFKTGDFILIDDISIENDGEDFYLDVEPAKFVIGRKELDLDVREETSSYIFTAHYSDTLFSSSEISKSESNKNYYYLYSDSKEYLRTLHELSEIGELKSTIYNIEGKEVVILQQNQNDSSGYYKELWPGGTPRKDGNVITGHYFTFKDSIIYNDSIPVPDILKELIEFDFIIKIKSFAPIGEWKEFYRNGNIRSTGSFTLAFCVEPDGCVFYYPDPSNPNDFPDPIRELYCQSVKDGLWKYFAENGDLLYEVNFDEGRVVEIKTY